MYEVIPYLGWIVSFACINHKLAILQGVSDQLLGFSLTNNAVIIAQVSMRNYAWPLPFTYTSRHEVVLHKRCMDLAY